jgi:hypothetical protein
VRPADVSQRGIVSFVGFVEPVHRTVLVTSVEIPEGDSHGIFILALCVSCRINVGDGPLIALSGFLLEAALNHRRQLRRHPGGERPRRLVQTCEVELVAIRQRPWFLEPSPRIKRLTFCQVTVLP